MTYQRNSATHAERFGALLKAHREARGWTIAQVAEAAAQYRSCGRPCAAPFLSKQTTQLRTDQAERFRANARVRRQAKAFIAARRAATNTEEDVDADDLFARIEEDDR